MPVNNNPNPDQAAPGRWTLIKDILSFQVKLMLDGFRDFILVPVSIVFGIISLLQPGKKPGTSFYALLRLGRRTDHWINLFSAADRHSEQPPADKPGADIDDLIHKAEQYAVEKVQSGELSRQAKEHFDQILNTVRSRRQ